jgi:lysophospholipase L1-like esterase
MRLVAAESDALFVDPRPAFLGRLAAGTPPRELTIPDGHPTTKGYQLIGELIVDELLEKRKELGR